MGAGLSMASVNKIKELANSREYSLAPELVEHQDLTKSLNPQFLRLCGEIYIKNDRYKDARRCLIMAHRLGPESKRVLYTFVELYLRMGYFQLAKTYYDMYMFDANAYDSRDMEYVWNKHEHADDYKTLEPLIAGYAHNLDYDWSFELYLLYKKEEKQNEAATLAELYHASFKNSDNSQIILDIEAGKVKVDTYFDIYADTEAVDDDPDMEALRAEEQELLATDDLRMHPKEAEITIMYEDSYTPAGSEKKVQKMLKKQEREEQRKEKKLLKKQKQQEKAEAAAAAEAEKTEAEVKPATEEKTETETKVPETEQKTSEKTTVTEQETAEKASVTETSEQKTAEEASETEAEEPEKEKKKGFFQRRKRKKHEEESETTDADIEETKEVTSESEDVKPSEEPKESNSDISSEIAETTGQAEDMRHGKGTIAKDVVVVDEDDGFEAEADTIEELASKEHVTQETETKEAEVTTAKKTTFEFQTVELAPEDFEEEYEVDDFSETVDDEFGEMKMPEPKPEIEETVEEEPEIEEIAEETVEEEPEVEEEIEEPEVVEPEPEIEAEPESEIEETVEESVKEEPEAELEIEETVEEEPEAEEEIEEPEVVEPEPEVETEPELEIEETVEDVVEEEPETELEIEETVEEEPEVEEEIEEPEVVEPEPEVESESEPEIEETVVEEAVEEEPETEEEIEEPEEEPKEEFHVAPFTTKPEKKKLDFPVFKSSLFPDYHKEVKIVENNFNEIMEEAQDKMTENMQKEEQMQREAEALLASLGISIDSIPTTPQAEKKEEQPVQKGPSRDELKASLKIDSVKKNLLKRVKEYR